MTLSTLLASGLFLVTVGVMLIGLASIILPFLPAIPIIWLGIFLYGVGTNFAVVDPNFMLLISLLSFSTIFLDYTTSMWGTRKLQGSFIGLLGAVAGGIVGSLFGIFGALVVGPVMGAIIAEMFRGRDNVFGIETNKVTIIGFVGGTIIKFSVGLAMIGLFLWKVMTTPGI